MLGPNLAGLRGTKITGFISYTLVTESEDVIVMVKVAVLG
jgi:hypothetical protein